MKLFASLALLVAFNLSQPLRADTISDGEAAAKASDCFSCHQVTRKVVGPSYVEVAKKYKGKAGAAAYLVKKIKTGGSGVWGAVPMSAHPQLADAEIEKIVKWVLAQSGAAVASSAPAVKPQASVAPAKHDAKGEEAKPAAGIKKRKRAQHGAGEAHGEKMTWSTDDEVRTLMTKQDCFGCHSGLNRAGDPTELPWPSFKQIKDKYAKNRPVETLVKKVRAGEGAGAWKMAQGLPGVPHPKYEALPSEAVSAMVVYVLDGKAVSLPPAGAVDAKSLSPEDWMRKKSDCFSCHAVNQKVIGPAYKEVAKKYAGANAATVASLVKKVKNGGSGTWGSVPMTAHASAPDDLLENAVRWILTQK